jgi:D-alanyl-D-alanine carboxypeptidase
MYYFVTATLATIAIAGTFAWNHFSGGMLLEEMDKLMHQGNGAPIEVREYNAGDKPQNANSFEARVLSAESSRIQPSGVLPERERSASDIKIWSKSSVVIDVDSGTILHYDNGRLRLPIASLTKMMTAVIVVEKIHDLNEPVTIDREAILADGTKIGCPTSVYCPTETMHVGERLTVRDLLRGMLLASANDAAIALGKYVGGSQKGFADLMNEKSKELHLADSHFCNPSGLDEDNCYSSAYDLARVAAYSMRYDEIWQTMKMPEYTFSSVDGKYSHIVKNTDLLIGELPNCIGGKTGFTYNAGKSLMMAARDNTGKHRIIAVILDDPDRWTDMRNLIDWCFASYRWK